MVTASSSFGRQQVAGVLRDVFGFHSFRRDQEEVVQAILSGQDCFVVMPTGGGKSLCYQLPAHIMSGTCIVISPLISLMKDQVDAAVATGLRASFLNSSLPEPMKRRVTTQFAGGELDLLYVSPERFAMPEFAATMRSVALSFVAIDEAHCISEWGHDFRPDYLGLSTIVKDFPAVPVTAFTATATHRVQKDIVSKLGLRSPHTVRASFNRPNLFYKAVQKRSPSDQILSFVQAHRGEPGIIYRTTRKSVEQTADMLIRHGVKALPYHAGLDDAARVRNQDAFNRDEVDVMVATIAFGMGIDKSNIRYVLHGDLPKNIESYYQETGRSGRDGEPAQCLLLFGYGDIPKIRFFIDQIEDGAEKQHAIKCLNDMVNYATIHACRRKQLLNYFGETWPPTQRSEGGGQRSAASGSLDRRNPAKPGSSVESPLSLTSEIRSPNSGFPCCDVCSGEVESVDATRDAQIIMSAIARTGQRFGITHIVDVVTGADTERIRQFGHDKVKTYGAGADRDKRHWRTIVDNLLAQGLVSQTPGDYPVLRLEPKGEGVLFGATAFHILRTLRAQPARGKRAAGGGAFDEQLFEGLRSLRKQLAAEQGVPPYVVFSDKTLHDMARHLPESEDALLRITGVGETKLRRYGQAFIDAIRTFRESHCDAPAPGAAGSDDMLVEDRKLRRDMEDDF